jgi:DNA-binding IscR family transcriptional regulator
MRYDSRLSAALHGLLHMAEQQRSATTGRPVTSETLARAMGTNPVVVRRMMAGLREQGFVRSEKGHGGGWTIACDLSKVTLRNVYDALGCPSVLAMGNRNDRPQCLVEQAVNAALNQAFSDAEALLLARLDGVTLAELAADFHARFAAHGSAHDAAHRNAS